MKDRPSSAYSPAMSVHALRGGALFGLLLVSSLAPAARAEAPSALVDEAASLPAPPPLQARTTAPPPLPVEEHFGGYTPGADAGLPDFIWAFVKSMLMLGVVLALIYLLLHKGLGRLVARTQSGRRMKMVERITLDPRRALYLVEVDGKDVLFAGSEGGVVPVHVGGEREAPPTSFKTELERQRGEGPALAPLKKVEG
jgi:flagellar protein FliO/FliZ